MECQSIGVLVSEQIDYSITALLHYLPAASALFSLALRRLAALR
jgi:hypothetical protein